MAQIEAELTARLYCTLALGFTGKSSSSLWLLELAEGGARGGETEERQQSTSSAPSRRRARLRGGPCRRSLREGCFPPGAQWAILIELGVDAVQL